MIISGSKKQQQKDSYQRRVAIFSHTWSDTLKTKDDTKKFDMKIILMPL